ncbi:YhgE/Pip N-terminal domain [Acidipropionibacterium jensenii]|uniref:YhgE/Pip N-terminal domain n=1 Tax=Acidipropionibacterium jensenii TaxID=1749 RepID=A0A448P059_9ACTN|nr:YhgE/Pip domain-containing protein [Acidipropionibacterium jensenii]VEI03546.1 YhgE/Pip N-terminal domain [Acidipropionibacterium jensenii]
MSPRTKSTASGSSSARPRAERSHSTIALSWHTVVALVLVPLVVAGALIGTTWKMTNRLSQVQAAIVNQDAGVTLGGQFVPLGRQLSGELIKSSTTTTDGRPISWVLADSAGAAKGLKDGSYAAVVTIPKSFSKDATSYSANKGDQARQAVITVATSDSSPVTDSAIATMTAQAAQNQINKTLNSQYLDNMYIGLNKSASGMVSLSKGASQLNDGAQQLTGGVKSATSGSQQLSNGLGQLDKGGQTLTSGGSQLLVGVRQLASGVALLDANGSKLNAGGTQLASGARTLDAAGSKLNAGGTQLASGTRTLDANGSKLNAGGTQLRNGANQLSAGINQIDRQLQQTSGTVPSMSQEQLAQIQQLSTGATAIADGSAGVYAGMQRYQGAMARPTDSQIAQVVNQICAQNAQACATDAARAQLAAGVKAGMAAAAQSMGSSSDPDSLMGGARATSEGARSYASKVSEGIDQLTATLKALPGQIGKQITALKDGVHQLATGANQVSSGVSTYTNGVSRYTAGVHTLSSGVSTYTNGVSQYTAGVHTLSSGVSTYTKGVSQYTGGVHTMAQQMPTLTTGAQQYVAGVGQFAQGVHQTSQGADKLYAGQVKLSQGAVKFAQGSDTFATDVAKGAKQVPTYSASDRQKLSDAVSSPVRASSTPMGTSAWVVGLILILGLWIGALAIWTVARTVPSRVLTSSRSTLSLLWSSLSTGAGVMAASAAGLALLATLTTGISVPRGLGLFGMLLLVGAMFLAVNHALAGWLHAIGRFISVILVAAASAVGLVSAVPGPVRWVHDISPLKPAMEALTAILAGHSPTFGSLLTIIMWLLIGGLASLLAVNRARHISPAKVIAELT